VVVYGHCGAQKLDRIIADDLGLELIVRHVAYGDLETRLVAIMEDKPQPGAGAEQADYSYPVASDTTPD
jgi:hypothetical protein